MLVRLRNTLRRDLEPLVLPGLSSGSRLSWYACGPTVYDDAHLGHARSYVCQDVLRRVLQRARPSLAVVQVLGMTDVDDKIVGRARAQGVPWRQLARHYEDRFLEDMAALGVLPPTAITRVSEHMDDIVAFVAQLVRQGAAYQASDGSVYFDTRAFGARKGGYVYPKLHPKRALGEGEETEEGVVKEGGKRAKEDFALWKAVAEDGWPSPWGPMGRPGWHIECSAMSSKWFGDKLDLHTGGIDLQFPHHDNELAQCEAFHNTPMWCGHFVHTGHLHVHGLKMSKSLKNFTSIRDYLAQHEHEDDGSGKRAARLFRLFCLHSHYADPVDYTPATTVQGMVPLDNRVKVALRTLERSMATSSPVSPAARSSPSAEALELSLLDRAHAHRHQYWAALCDDLDTGTALNCISHFASDVNREAALSTSLPIRPLVAADLLSTLTSLLDTVGLDYQHNEQQGEQSRRQHDPLQIANALADFRGKVKQNAQRTKSAELFKLCDEVRDVTLPPLGVVIKDLPDCKADVVLAPPSCINEKGTAVGFN